MQTPKTCSVDGCGDNTRKIRRGLCPKHYMRWLRRRGGLEGASRRKYANNRERIAANVDIDPKSGCWVWRLHLDRNGYGRVHTPQKEGQLAYRVSYIAFVGPVPEGLVLDHLCRNRACCNPQHLEPVTTRENLLRGDTFQARNVAKTECLRGHPFDDENTYRNPKGHRVCRSCMRMRGAASYRRKKEPAS